MTTSPKSKRSTPSSLISTEELAAYIAIPVRTIEKWRELGTAPRGHKVGRHWRYRMSDVDAWLAERAA